MSLITGLLGNFLPYIAGGIAILLGLWGYGRSQKKAGRAEQVAKQAAADKKARDIGDQVENDIGALPKGAAREELRKWGSQK